MTIWYVDPINGNDANTGVSFAQRCQSIAGVNAKSAPALAAGDTVKLIKSDDPVTTTLTTAAWTDGSKTITLPSSVTQTVSLANSTWTASTNVTTATATNRKYSTGGAQIVVGAAFTTGKAAYTATSALDLSGYQQISFWVYLASGTMTADNDVSLALCSDATGDVIVNSIPIHRIRGTAGWNRVVVNTGAALGSNINSVALYVNVDRGTQTFILNAIFASKAASDVDAITLSSLITPVTTSTGDWWSIDMIDGTTITLSQDPNFNLTTTTVAQGYGSATGANAVGIKRREPIVLPSNLNETSQVASTNWSTMGKSGTGILPAQIITISGGWSTVDMSAQTGDTYIAPQGGWGIGLVANNYISYSNINPVRFYYGFYTSTSTLMGVYLTANNISGCYYGVSSQQNSAYPGLSLNITNLNQNYIGGYIGASGGSGGSGDTLNITNANGNVAWGISIQGASSGTPVGSSGSRIRITFNSNSIRRNGNTTLQYYNTFGGLGISGVSDTIFNLSYVSHNYGRNITIGGSAATSYECTNNKFLFTNTSAANSLACIANQGGIYMSGTGNQVYLMDQTTYTPLQLTGGYYAIMTGDRSNSTIYGGTINGSAASIWLAGGTLNLQNTTNTAVTPYTMSNNQMPEAIYWQSYGGVATDNRIYYNPVYVGSITTDTTTRHTASGVSWKMTQVGSTSYYAPSATYPMELPIGQVAVNAGTPVTASVWLYPTSVFQVVKLRVYYQNTAAYAPFLSNETTVDLTGKTNTWFQTSLTTTPAAAGVYSYSICVYGAASAASVYVDDFTVGQV